MKVSQIAQILTSDSVSEETIIQLQQDPRVSVGQLIKKYERRQTAMRLESQRLHTLFRFERALLDDGFELIAGVDEAGRGPLAGPVVVGAAILPANFYLPRLNDSKKLSAKQREELYHKLKEKAVATAVSIIDAAVIDEINVYQATIKGMYHVIEQLYPRPHAALIDAVPLPDLRIYSSSIIDGDALSASIAAASIIAKVERDKIMDKYDLEFPQYGFSRHKGYGTAEHFAALVKHGPCPIHRRSFDPIKTWVKNHED
ncbi:Ribonuclease HII [bioreactor metagenome]|uniref:Ribonuclease HII n=1 Tax=bioreactor metagenome TaxID=1076179 RepID=A0A644T0J3_9ZZZZ